MKIKNFDFFYNKEKKRKCLILGGSPSINEIDYKNFDGIIISMGDIPIRIQDECNVDYWINANSEFPIPDIDYKTINKFKNTTLLFAHSVLRTLDYVSIKKNIEISWFEYDQRHFGGISCNNQIDSRFYLNEKQECCNHIGQTTIQEFLQEKYTTIDHYSTGSTVAIHALSLAIILGCKTIYIGGVELPIDEKDYKYFGANSLADIFKDETGGVKINKLKIKKFFARVFNFKIKSVFYSDIPSILNDFKYLNNLCIKEDIKLFNLCNNSSLNKIPNFKYLNPEHINAR